MSKTIVIGAEPTGLSAAYHLGKEAVLLEQHASIGGWCRSSQDDGFTFDYAGRSMVSNDPYVHEMYRILLGNNIHWQDREAWIYSKKVYTRFPFQGALYGLPADVIKECIVGAIEARYEMAQTPPRNFEEFIYKVWGAGIAKHFAIPYNRKLWAVPLAEMETSWLGDRVPMPNILDMIDGALMPTTKPIGPNTRFGYPLRGGFQALMEGFLPIIKGQIRLNTQVQAINPFTRTILLADGEELKYDHIISTMPLPILIQCMADFVPPYINIITAQLRHVSVRCINLGIAREHLTDKHWIYYPEDSIFHRIFVQGNASPSCNPPGGFGLTCEITYSPHKPLPCDGDDLIQRCINDCHKVGIFNPDDEVIVANQVDMPYAYVVYDHNRAKNVAFIRAWLSEHDIILAGRYSEWEYYNSDHAFIAGKRAAETVQQLREGITS